MTGAYEADFDEDSEDEGQDPLTDSVSCNYLLYASQFRIWLIVHRVFLQYKFRRSDIPLLKSSLRQIYDLNKDPVRTIFFCVSEKNGPTAASHSQH